MEDKLFKLLRIGLEITKPNNEDLSPFMDISEFKWNELINIAQDQGVLGFTFDGIEKINSFVEFKKSSTWFYEAYNGVLLRESLNAKQHNAIVDLCTLWKQHEIQMLLLKGQGNGLNYPKPLHRDCGDIDCFLYGQYDKGNDIIRLKGIPVNEDWEKHSKFTFNGETIENHQFFVMTLDEKWWKMLHNELSALLVEDEAKIIENSFFVPPVQFNALFLTYHAMAHFEAGNMRLKQILDWAMFVKVNNDVIDWGLLRNECKKYKMDAFLDVMNGLILRFFYIKANGEKCNIINDHLLNKVMWSVFYDKDFIWKDDSKSRWAGRFHFLFYVLKNRWKFNLVGSSSFKQLWLYVTTYRERNK